MRSLKTMSSLPLLDKIFEGIPEPVGAPLTGEELKLSGIESVVSHTPEWYRDAFIQAVEDLPKGTWFTVEDIRDIVGDPPDQVSPNCMGGLMRRAAGKKLIIRTSERRNAKRASLHASEIAVWRRV